MNCQQIFLEVTDWEKLFTAYITKNYYAKHMKSFLKSDFFKKGKTDKEYKQAVHE